MNKNPVIDLHIEDVQLGLLWIKRLGCVQR